MEPKVHSEFFFNVVAMFDLKVKGNLQLLPSWQLAQTVGCLNHKITYPFLVMKKRSILDWGCPS